MQVSLKRALDVIRVWLGFGDLSTEHASPAHGWLLPPTPVPVRRTAGRETPRPGVIGEDPGFRG